MSRDDLERELAAWRDGELRWHERLRVARRLRRDPAARELLERLERAAELLCEIDHSGPAPDLWESVRLRLPALDAARRAAAPTARRWLRPALGWSAAGALAAAAATVALVLRLGAPTPGPVHAPAGAVRWLDARGLPMLVLRDDVEGTIIWVPERAAAESSSRRAEARDGFV